MRYKLVFLAGLLSSIVMQAVVGLPEEMIVRQVQQDFTKDILRNLEHVRYDYFFDDAGREKRALFFPIFEIEGVDDRHSLMIRVTATQFFSRPNSTQRMATARVHAFLCYLARVYGIMPAQTICEWEGHQGREQWICGTCLVRHQVMLRIPSRIFYTKIYKVHQKIGA